MTLNTSEVLDLSKENVQPLRQGRKAAHLKTALQAQTDPETQYRLQKQRENYEYMIRMYEGDDPLEPYCNYVAWLEQSFTKLNRESNLILVLEDALNKFRDCDRYKQDPRFVHLMIKYINMQSNALELYQLVYNQGLGTMCSALYKAWAEELDKCNDFKRADQIYQLGMQCRAQPVHELEDAHIQFQLSIARRMLEGNINNTETASENNRSALSKLQPSKVKSNRISKDTAGVFQLATKNSDNKNNAVSVGKFKIYQEDETDGFAKSDYKMKNEKLPRASITERENTLKPSKWHGQKHKQSAVFRSSMPTTPSFQIHEDPDAGCENLKTTIRPRALKIRKEEFRCPVAVFEDPDPTKKPMYPKHLVYVGGRDIQLEELRAAMYWKRIEKESKLELERNKLQESKESCNVSTAEVKNSSSLPNDHSTRKLDTKTESHSIPNTPKKNESADVEALVGLSEKGGAPPLASPSQSFTINTKVALNVINSMWGSPFPSSNEKRKEPTTTFDDSLFKVPQARKPTSLPPFKLFVDEDVDKPSTPFEEPLLENLSLKDRSKTTSNFIDKENMKPETLPFSVFCDDDEPPMAPSEPKSKHSFPAFCDDADAQPPISSSESKNKLPVPLDDADIRPTVPSSEPKDKFTFPVFCDDANTRPIVPCSESKDKLTFPVFCDDTNARPIVPCSEPKKKFSFPVFEDAADKRPSVPNTEPKKKISFPVFCDDAFQPASEPKNKFSFPTRGDETKPAQNADKFSFPVFCDEMLATSTQKSEPQPVFLTDNGFSFPAFGDDGIMPLVEEAKVPVKSNFPDINKLLFPVDSDEDVPSSAKNFENRTPVQTDKYSIPLIIPVNLADTPLEPENKENLPPKSYATPIERRPLSGILTPATDVPFKDLNDEESEDDDYCKAGNGKTNDFDEETCSTKAFAIMLPSSTPFARPNHTVSSRKSLLYNGSYISEENTPQTTTTATESIKFTNGQHLSLILENSKEQGSNSSGGSSAVNK